MTGRTRWTIAALGLVALASAVVVALTSGGWELASWIAAVLALASLVQTMFSWARTVPAQRSTQQQVGDAKQQLAALVREQVDHELDALGLGQAEARLAARWRRTTLEVMDFTAATPLSEPGNTASLGELTEELRALTPQRLVILGEAGMGKSTLATLLTRELLENRLDEQPVPVILSLSDWRPDDESLRGWLERRLADTHPALRAAAYGPDAPRSLLTGHHILPVLDGLDEVPQDVRPRVLADLRKGFADRTPLILTCRTQEYTEAIRVRGAGALPKTLVIEPVPLDADTKKAYVTCGQWDGQPEWRAFLDRFADEDDRAVRALSSPLDLWLFRAVHTETGDDPGPFLEELRQGGEERGRTYLLARGTEAILASPADGPPNGSRPAAWEPARAARWLQEIAVRLDRENTTDLAWWHLRLAIAGWRVRVAYALAAGLVFGALYGIAYGLIVAFIYGAESWPVHGPLDGLGFGLVLGVVAGAMCAAVQAIADPDGMRGRGRPSLRTAGRYLAAALTPTVPALFFLSTYLGIPYLDAALVSTVLALAALFRGFATTPARAAFTVNVTRIRSLGRSLGRSLVVGLLAGLVCAPVVGHAGASVVGPVDASAGVLVYRLVDGLVIGTVSGLGFGLFRWVTAPTAMDQVRDPRTSLAGDRALSLLILIGLAGAFGAVFAFLGRGLLAAFLAGFVPGFICLLWTARPWPAYLVTLVQLAASGRLPMRLMPFLSDMRRVGMLRQVGGVFQFRHKSFQDYFLAARAREPT